MRIPAAMMLALTCAFFLICGMARASLPLPGEPGMEARTITAAGTTTTIRVLVMVTQAAWDAGGQDMPLVIASAVADANEGYANSALDLTLELAGILVTPYVETTFSDDDLERFALPGDGYMDEVHAARDADRADVAVLVLNSDEVGGRALAIGATAATAFARVSLPGLMSDHVFAHEIGHLLGARHDVRGDSAADSTADSTHGYAHGFVHESTPDRSWRTIMAYDCLAGCPRINLWSSPLLVHEGQVAGTAEGADNRRVLLENMARVAAFR